MMKFTGKVLSGTVHDRTLNTSRQGEWLPAKEIPLQVFNASYGSPSSNSRHPHNVEGLAWCLTESGWRNMKNARVHQETVRELTFDEGDARLFF
jgi:hypothetical protein